jgi:hypothetical protein
MNANLASIMPQVVAVWCKRQGHDVSFLCYTGFENLSRELPQNLDLVFIGAFTESAQLAYALSNQFHSQGVVTVLGGPHARCFPQDARKYFDYVLGFTDEAIIQDVVEECSPHRPTGLHLSAPGQPGELPGVQERWEFIKPTVRKSPFIKIVPMLGSIGCPYSCGFCIDSTVPYQLLDTDILKDDLRFLMTVFKRPVVGWHDPNFGVRFDEVIGTIEEAVPPDSIDFIAESSLSLLSEPRLQRLQRTGFKALLPGIESWFDLGEKSKAGGVTGMEKVKRVAEHVNLVMRYIPYVQANFVLGLDGDAGPHPFELTRRFIDLAPGAFPGYSLLTSFGEAAPINLEYQRENRTLGFPFHFLSNTGAMNVRPKNYSWPAFYQHVVDTTEYSFSPRAIGRRFAATRSRVPRWMNVVRAVSSEGYGRIRYHKEIHRRLLRDSGFRGFYEQATDVIPPFFEHRVRKALGHMWDWLPPGAMRHDPNAYLKSRENGNRVPALATNAQPETLMVSSGEEMSMPIHASSSPGSET